MRLHIELKSESDHHGFSFVYQVPFDGQLAVFSVSSFDLTSFDELAVVRPGGSDVEGSCSQQFLVARSRASVEFEAFI